METLNHQNYREILKAEFLKKSEKNKGFSLRRFAQILDLQASFLSEVLNNKKNLSDEMAAKISEKLSWSTSEKEYFFNLVQLEKTKDPLVKEKIETRIRNLQTEQNQTNLYPFHDLSVDQFKIIADWQHFAILGLLDQDVKPQSSSILAQKLGLHVYDVEIALSRLKRLDLVEESADSCYSKVKHHVTINSATPNQALKHYHKQMLSKILEAQDEQTPLERYTGTENLLLTKEQKELAHTIFEEALQKVLKLSQESKGNTNSELYHCGIHMIKLSKDNK